MTVSPVRGGYWRAPDSVYTFATEQEARVFAADPANTPPGYKVSRLDRAEVRPLSDGSPGTWYRSGRWTKLKLQPHCTKV